MSNENECKESPTGRHVRPGITCEWCGEAAGKAEGVELPMLDLNRPSPCTVWEDGALEASAFYLPELVERYMDSLESLVLASQAKISSLQRELDEARKGDQIRREKMMDVMHTLSVIREGRASNVWASANACWEVLNSVLPSPPEPAKKEEA